MAEIQIQQNYPLRSPFTRRGDYYFSRETFAGVGQESFFLPPAENPDMFQLLTNVLPIARGTLQRRWGYSLFSTAPTAPVGHQYEYQNASNGNRYIIHNALTFTLVTDETGATINANIFTPTGSVVPRVMYSRDWAYLYDQTANDLKKWNSVTGLQGWGITAPVTAISVGAPVAGAITLTSGRNYFCVFQNATTGQLSDLNPVSASTGPLTSQNVPLSSIPVSGDAQVTNKLILATADGGDQTTLYFVTQLANATTTYTDNTPNATLILGNVYLQTDEFGTEHGVALNTPPPNGSYAIKHRGRVYFAVGTTLFFSKNLSDLLTSTGTICGRYEECWPAVNQLDVSTNVEQITGLMSDGVSLYIGTQRHVRRLDGDGPTTYSQPEVCFNEVGVINQDVWKVIFREGSPSGAMWLTPDLRVIMSDFNTYIDVGTPIQDVLNSANAAQVTSISRAEMFSSNAYDLYVLAIPTGSNTSNDTLCVFDLRARRWCVWNLTDLVSSMLNNITANGTPHLLFGTAANPLYRFDPTQAQDRVGNTPVGFAVTMKSTWQDFGDQTAVKVLQEMEPITNDAGLLVTIEGASDDASFAAPTAITTSAPLVTPPLANIGYRVFLAGKTSRHRFYRLTFVSPSSSTVNRVLDGYKVWYYPAHRI